MHVAYSIDVLIAHVRWSMERAHALRSGLTAEILQLEGMTGSKTRHFYNNLASLRGASYLEVGTWKGSSLISACYCNPTLDASVIDNWSEFDGPKDAFFENLNNVFGCIPNNIHVFDCDCFAPDPPFKNIDIYLYDGPHQEIEHEKGITNFWPCLANNAIIIVDDWNWPEVRSGTLKGLKDVGANINYITEVAHAMENNHTPLQIGQNEYWNGLGVFVVSK